MGRTAQAVLTSRLSQSILCRRMCDGLELVFQKGSLDAIAELALLRGTGARALKSIIEESLLNSMFEIPSRPEIKRCLISERSIREALEPEFEFSEEGDGPARLVGESA